MRLSGVNGMAGPVEGGSLTLNVGFSDFDGNFTLQVFKARLTFGRFARKLSEYTVV